VEGLAWVDGVRVDLPAPSIPILDRGFLYGDSAFEVLRTYGGRAFALDEHLDRLAASCARLSIPLRDPRGLRAEVVSALEETSYSEAYVRVIVTRGVTPIGLGFGGALVPRRVVLVTPFAGQPPELYERGVSVRTVLARAALDGTRAAGAKASNYLPNILALEEARTHGAYEAVSLGPGGELLEGSTSNVFLVRDGRVATPALEGGILGGITRRFVLEAARDEGIPVAERVLFPADLYRADEAFITSTLRELAPVVGADGVPVGRGVPGPVTRRLHTAFRRSVQRVLERDPSTSGALSSSAHR
jgi:branched-chain amino acid aminotransferase